MIKNKKVAFVVALHQSEKHRHNGFELFNSYLESIYKSCRYPFKVFAFDNASEEKFVVENQPDNLIITRIEDQYKGGCTYTWNEGIKMAIQEDFDAVVITSDDQVYNETINDFIDVILTHELKDDCVFGPLSNEPGPGHALQLGNKPNGKIFKMDSNKKGTEYGNINGFCMGMSKECIENNYYDDDGNFYSTEKERKWGGQDVEVQERVTHSVVVGTCFVHHIKQGGWRDIRKNYE